MCALFSLCCAFKLQELFFKERQGKEFLYLKEMHLRGNLILLSAGTKHVDLYFLETWCLAKQEVTHQCLFQRKHIVKHKYYYQKICGKKYIFKLMINYMFFLS